MSVFEIHGQAFTRELTGSFRRVEDDLVFRARDIELRLHNRVPPGAEGGRLAFFRWALGRRGQIWTTPQGAKFAVHTDGRSATSIRTGQVRRMEDLQDEVIDRALADERGAELER